MLFIKITYGKIKSKNITQFVDADKTVFSRVNVYWRVIINLRNM